MQLIMHVIRVNDEVTFLFDHRDTARFSMTTDPWLVHSLGVANQIAQAHKVKFELISSSVVKLTDGQEYRVGVLCVFGSTLQDGAFISTQHLFHDNSLLGLMSRIQTLKIDAKSWQKDWKLVSATLTKL